jgi:hypothetical protein
LGEEGRAAVQFMLQKASGLGVAPSSSLSIFV